jgi:hypothetical protein
MTEMKLKAGQIIKIVEPSWVDGAPTRYIEIISIDSYQEARVNAVDVFQDGTVYKMMNCYDSLTKRPVIMLDGILHASVGDRSKVYTPYIAPVLDDEEAMIVRLAYLS